jgi:hypothetical protein
MTRRKQVSPPPEPAWAPDPADPAERIRRLQSPEDAAFNKLFGRLKAMHVETSRDEELRFELKVITDNIVQPRDPDLPPGADNMREGTSLLIVGETGAGKTKAIRHALKNHPAFPGYGVRDSGCQLISISVPSPFTLRTLGMALLRGAGYRTSREYPQNIAWSRARFQLSGTAILVVHIEDIQDVLQSNAKEIKQVLNSLKGLMTDLGWPPLHLIFTGLPEIADVLKFDYQVPRRSGFIHFKPIDADADFKMIKEAAAKYGKVAGVSVAALNSHELVGRLCHAAHAQLGLVFELLVLALEICLRAKRKVLTQEDFADAYARRTLEPIELNPFVGDNWAEIDTSIIQKKPEEIVVDDQRKKKAKPRYSRSDRK